MAAKSGDVIRRRTRKVEREESRIRRSEKREGFSGGDIEDELRSGNGVTEEFVAAGSENVQH